MLREGDLWPGYAISLPGDDRKYHVRRSGRPWNVWVSHAQADEFAKVWTPSSTSCPELIRAVNRVALRYNGRRGGSFYFNEYRQVLKPVYGRGQVELRYAGEFSEAIFTFDLGNLQWQNGCPPARNLRPGQDWTGPRTGIPYWIERRSKRIYRPRILQSEDDFVRVEHREYLDEHCTDYSRLSTAVSRAKNGSGGRFYVTESGCIFAPYWEARRKEWPRRYVGSLWDLVSCWYPKCE